MYTLVSTTTMVDNDDITTDLVPPPGSATVFDLRRILPRFFSARNQLSALSGVIYDQVTGLQPEMEYDVVGTPIDMGLFIMSPGPSGNSVERMPVVSDRIARIRAHIANHRRIRATFETRIGLNPLQVMTWSAVPTDPPQLLVFYVPIDLGNGDPPLRYHLTYSPDATVVQRAGPHPLEYEQVKMLRKHKALPADVIDRVRDMSGMRTKGAVISQSQLTGGRRRTARRRFTDRVKKTPLIAFL